ncbi:MAG: GDP-mannose 4,6-dehydratase [Candidatus Omnitrophota bacterium]|nr:GDP-mannose 4,6-dehydratase [Candidatus Omnitrophota bacterium]
MAKRQNKIKLPSMGGKKVLITGGLGFIGSNLAHKCMELGAGVTVFDCMDPHSGGNLYNIKGIRDSIELVLSDVLNFDEVSRYIVDKDILFNCAASTSHPFSMKEPWIDLDVNCRGIINLLEASRRFNKKIKFVHVGTSTQLGKLHFRPADERHPEFPTDIYSANKSVSEKYVLIYGMAYNMPVAVIRLPNVFGPRASIHSSDFTFVNYFIGQALQDKDVTIYGDGTQLRNVIYVDDCVNALILSALSDKANGEVFFATGDKHYSVAEIAKTITECIGSGRAKFVPWPKDRKVTEVGDAVITNKKISEKLGWQPRTDFISGLVKTRQYYKSCLNEYLR